MLSLSSTKNLLTVRIQNQSREKSRSEKSRSFIKSNQNNPESGTGRLVNSDLMEPKVVITGSICLKGKKRTGTVRIPGGGTSPEGRGKETSLFRMSG